MRAYFTVLTVICFLGGIAPLPHRQANTSSNQDPHPTLPHKLPLAAGKVESNIYTNSSIGLVFTPPDGMVLDEPQVKGSPGVVPLLVTVKAAANLGLVGSLLRTTEDIAFYADDLGYLPVAQRNSASYLKKVIRANQHDAFLQVDGPSEVEVQGARYARADFSRDGSVAETVLVIVRNNYSYVFIFTASTPARVADLVASSKINFTD